MSPANRWVVPINPHHPHIDRIRAHARTMIDGGVDPADAWDIARREGDIVTDEPQLEPVPWGSPGDDPDPPRLLRRPAVPAMPRIIGTAAEDIPAAAAIVLDLTTGLAHLHRQQDPPMTDPAPEPSYQDERVTRYDLTSVPALHTSVDVRSWGMTIRHERPLSTLDPTQEIHLGWGDLDKLAAIHRQHHP